MERPNFCDLPNELISLVAENARDVGGQKLVRNLCRTNRRVYSIVQRILYRHINIKRDQALDHITRTLIENPSLRSMIRIAEIHTKQWRPRRCRQYNWIFGCWQDIQMNETRLSPRDLQLLVIARSHCTNKASDNIQCVFGLLLFLLDRTEQVQIFDLDAHWDVLDHVLSAGMTISPSSPALLPAVKTLELSGKYYLQKNVQSIYTRNFHPLIAFTTPFDLGVFIHDGPMIDWAILDTLTPGQNLPFHTIKLKGGHCTSSALCRLLRHCPNLRHLEIFFSTHLPTLLLPQQYECINTILPTACPQLRVLHLRFGRFNWRFFNESAQAFTCLRKMTNLKELRIELDSFVVDEDIGTLQLANMLPVRLEKMLLDATSYDEGPGYYTGAQTRKKTIEMLIQNLCIARQTKLPQLNTIIIGVKNGKPRQWTKDAVDTLKDTGASVKVTSGKETANIWGCSWNNMGV
ncbi:hypothetical protein EsH8_X_000555 [Colletotrichum jinshuiense]